MKLNQAFAALRKASVPTTPHLSDGEEDEHPPGPEVLEERIKHCCSVKEYAVSAH